VNSPARDRHVNVWVTLGDGWWSCDRTLLDEPFVPARRNAGEVLHEDIGPLSDGPRPLLPKDLDEARRSDPGVAQTTSIWAVNPWYRAKFTRPLQS
jgi:hypothetical protein